MFVFKNIYLLFLLFPLAFEVWACVALLSQKTRTGIEFAKVIICSMISTVFYLLAIYCTNKNLAYIFYGIYFSLIDVRFFIINDTICFFEVKKRLSSKIRKTFFSFFQVICSFDVVLLMFNVIISTKGGLYSYYELNPIYIDNIFFCFSPKANPLFIFHSIFCTSFSIYNLVLLANLCINTTKFYKSKFICMFLACLTILGTNILFITCNETIILDISILLFNVFTLIVFFVIYFWIPSLIKKRLFFVASKNISNAVFCFDNKNKCIYKNDFAEKICKENNEAWMNQYLNQKNDIVNSTQTFVFDDDLHIFLVEYKKTYDDVAKTKFNGSYIILNDYTNEFNKLEDYQSRSIFDSLTGVFNRTMFIKEVKRTLTNNNKSSYYLICSNIVNFRLINDVYGTEIGDLLLNRQAEIFMRSKNADCIIGRISGDKFAMLIEKDNFEKEMVIDSVKKVSQSFSNIKYPIVIKLGIYEIYDSTEDILFMFDKANLAMKNSIDDNQILCFYNSSLMEKLLYEKNIINEFKNALLNNRFKMFLQPQVNSKTEKCIGAEALARWQNQDLTYKKPNEFIPILENNGLLFELDSFIWEKAVEQLAIWQKQGFNDYYISVNISVLDFYYGDLYKIFTDLVKKYEISPTKLNLEITESFFMGDKNINKDTLSRLQDYGFGIEMDDFGSGYSSLNALKELNMDVLKIDMEFLGETDNEERGMVIIASIVKMAKALGMTVIFEGVETEKQSSFLKKIGVDIFQGFLYSKPLSVIDFEKKYLPNKTRGSKNDI